MNEKSSNINRELVKLVMEHQQDIFRYVFSLIPNRADAEDVFQNAISVICEKFDEFEPGSNFRAWAFSIARWEVRRARKDFARSSSRLLFSEEAIEAIAAASAEADPVEDNHRLRALESCLAKLKQRDRNMVLARYESDGGVEEASRCSGRSTAATYKALGRVRQLLKQCVSQQIQIEQGT